MREISFLLDSIMSLLVSAFLLRLLFQLFRADFRNPVVQAIVRLTNPLVMPLRRILPPIGRLDTASIVAVLIAQLARTALVELLGPLGLASLGALLISAVLTLLDTTLFVFLCAVIVYVVLSYVVRDGYNPLSQATGALVEPILKPLRRAIPPLGGLDWSPLIACLLIEVLRMVLSDRIAPLHFGR